MDWFPFFFFVETILWFIKSLNSSRSSHDHSWPGLKAHLHHLAADIFSCFSIGYCTYCLFLQMRLQNFSKRSKQLSACFFLPLASLQVLTALYRAFAVFRVRARRQPIELRLELQTHVKAHSPKYFGKWQEWRTIVLKTLLNGNGRKKQFIQSKAGC